MQIFIFGMHRSGTSVVTRILNLMGAYFGPEGISTGANQENPKGFWERKDIRTLNDEILHSIDAEWYRVTNFDISKLPNITIEEFERKAKKVILELDAHRPWVVKEPRFCLTFPLWRQILECPICIHVYRSPIQVAQSLTTRNGFPLTFGIALWERYTLSALESSKGLPCILVSHAEIMSQPIETVKRLYDQLIEVGVGGLRVPSEKEILAFIDGKLFHEKGTRDLEAQFINQQQLDLARAFQDKQVFEATLNKDVSAGAQEALQTFEEQERTTTRLHRLTAEIQEKDYVAKQLQAQVTATEQLRAAQHEQQIEQLQEQLIAAEQLQLQQNKQNEQLQEQLMSTEQLRAQHEQQIEQLRSDAEVQATVWRNKERILIANADKLKQEFNTLRVQIQEHVQQLSLRDNQLLSHSKDIQQLSRWLQQLNHDTDALLASWRWKSGNALVRFAEKLLLRPKVALAVDHMREVLKLFEAWTQRPAHYEAPTSQKKNDKLALVDQSSPTHKTPLLPGNRHQLSVDIVVCVHNALEDVKNCLTSVIEKTHRQYRLYIVNDGSKIETTEYLRDFTQCYQHVSLLENETAQRYTRAANRGLKVSTADYVVLLNSDTIVTPGWLDKLIECGESDPRIGIIGPLSNAATWQSVPELASPKGEWAVNALPEGFTVDDMADVVTHVSTKQFPRVKFINGFCFVIKRTVINKIGYFDEVNFPKGYGEENDYALRAGDAGFDLAIADHTYIYHAWSKSFSPEYRDEFSPKATAALQKKYDPQRITAGTEVLRNHPVLVDMRRRVSKYLHSSLQIGTPAKNRHLRVLFLLVLQGNGGGVHCVIQNALGMHQLGINVRVAVKGIYRTAYLDAYPNVPKSVFFFFNNEIELIAHAINSSVVIATHFSTVKLLKDIYQENKNILPAYFIQDYEPWIIPKNHPQQQEALNSYNLIPDMVCFAMADWIRDKIKAYHSVNVQKVEPSVDTELYHPELSNNNNRAVVRITAMVRPRTPRRAPLETMRLLKAVKDKYKKNVAITIFGCESDDPQFRTLPQDFDFDNRGHLSRSEVAETLRAADIFVDMSTFQAFGLTGIEAMASGCATILPTNGGSSEYAVHRQNALLVDTQNFDEAFSAVCELIENAKLRTQLAKEATRTVDRYSIRSGALSQILLFKQTLLQKSVTMIIPVYNAYEELKACIDSLLRHTSQSYRAILIDDCSPDHRVWQLIRSYAEQHQPIEAIRNEQNIGYTRTINKGLRMVPHGDVVLLNSDTQVTRRWIEKLREAAYSMPNVATITPLSNAAGAFSIPENNTVNEIPTNLTVDDMGKMVERHSRRIRPKVPTANGYCMYITRQALNKVGLFDEENFPQGYGEENDYCMRASAKGFIHLIDDSTFIYHKRSASFGNRKRAIFEASQAKLQKLHPSYKAKVTQWLANDELADFRHKLKKEIADRVHRDSQITITKAKSSTLLYIFHDGEGGTIHTSEDLISQISNGHDCLLLKTALDKWTLLAYRDNAFIPVQSYSFHEPWKIQNPVQNDRLIALRQICKDYGVDLVHIRHMLANGPEIIYELKSLGIPIVFSFHDFFTVCPTTNLIDDHGVYCAGHCSPGNGDCAVSKSWVKNPPVLKHQFVHTWRQKVGEALQLCDAFVTTSKASRSVIVDHYPFLDTDRFRIIEHGRDFAGYRPSAVRPEPEKRNTKVLLFGNLGYSKGIRLIDQLLAINYAQGQPFEFHFLGDLHGEFHPERHGGIRHGSFRRNELPDRLAGIAPSFTIISSIWPETFCHTLTESWAAGIPVFASAIGTLKERMERHGGGWLLDHRNPEAWFEGMLAVLHSPSEYQAKLEDIRKMRLRTTEEMANEYERLYETLLNCTRKSTTSAHIYTKHFGNRVA